MDNLTEYMFCRREDWIPIDWRGNNTEENKQRRLQGEVADDID